MDSFDRLSALLDQKPELKQKLLKYADMLIFENEKINLTAITDSEEVWQKHILDSLLAEPYIQHNARILDIGSGGGCPAIPLAIYRADLHITMLESVAKKCAFLNKCVDVLGLEQAKVANCRAEEHAKSNRESYDVVTARAVASLNILVEYAMPLLKIGGSLVAYKASSAQEEIEQCTRAFELLNCSLTAVYYQELCGYERNIVVITKTGETSMKYPRRDGMAVKRPLI